MRSTKWSVNRSVLVGLAALSGIILVSANIGCVGRTHEDRYFVEEASFPDDCPILDDDDEADVTRCVILDVNFGPTNNVVGLTNSLKSPYRITNLSLSARPRLASASS